MPGSSTSPPLSSIRALLVRPKCAGNVGAAARAIKNMGLGGLDIVEPHPERPALQFEREARRRALYACDVLDAARTCPTLDDAAGPATYLVATTGQTKRGEMMPSPREAAPALVKVAAQQPVAVLFGPEDHGLPNRLLRRASLGLHIPTWPVYASLNLAQSVMLVAYELRLAAIACDSQRAASGDSGSASTEHLNDLYRDLEDSLDRIDYLQEHTRAQTLSALKRLLANAAPLASEVRMLRGICRQIRWLAGQAGR